MIELHMDSLEYAPLYRLLWTSANASAVTFARVTWVNCVAILEDNPPIREIKIPQGDILFFTRSWRQYDPQSPTLLHINISKLLVSLDPVTLSVPIDGQLFGSIASSFPTLFNLFSIRVETDTCPIMH